MSDNQCRQCIGLEFFSEQEVVRGVKTLHRERFMKEIKEVRPLGAVYRELVRQNTFFKVLDAHRACVFIGDNRVSQMASIAPIEYYAKEDILRSMCDIVLWVFMREREEGLSA